MTIPDTAYERDQTGIPDGFIEGHFLHHRRNHVALPVRVWWGPLPDLENGGDMERSWRWNIEVAGVLLEDERAGRAMARFEDVWPRSARSPSQAPETNYREARIKYARAHDPMDPFGDLYGRIDHMTARPPF